MIEEQIQLLREMHTRRKFSSLHWNARAQNAHSVAALLWANSADGRNIAIYEGYLREAAVSLELILKGVIVARIETRRASPQELEESHDLPRLWKIAELPVLGREDRYRLVYFKSVLVWLGRYPTPLTAERWRRDIRERESDATFQNVAGGRVRHPTACGFPEFNPLFQVASATFGDLISQQQSGPVVLSNTQS